MSNAPDQKTDYPHEQLRPDEVLSITSWASKYLPTALYPEAMRSGHNQSLQDIQTRASQNALRDDDYTFIAGTEHSRLVGDYMSPRLQVDSQAMLDCKTEVCEFVDQWTEQHRDNTEILQTSIDHLPLSRELKAYVIIPVAAEQEDSVLSKTIAQYAKQTLSPKDWALLFFVNGGQDSDFADVDETCRRITELSSNYPQLPVRMCKLQYLTDTTMGRIRADAWDVALLDLYKNGVSGNTIGVSHDADTTWLSPDYLARMCAVAEARPDKDMLTCRLSWANEGDPESIMNRLMRYWEVVSESPRLQTGQTDAADANTAIRMSTYAATGGFERRYKLGEMLALRTKIAEYRHRMPHSKAKTHQGFQDIIEYVPDIRLKTNARRIYMAMAGGHPPGYAWENVPFMTAGDPVRDAPLQQLAAMSLDIKTQLRYLRSIDRLGLSETPPEIAERVRLFGRHLLRLPTYLHAIKE